MSSLINIIGIAFMIEWLSHIYIASITVALSRLVITFRITRTIIRQGDRNMFWSVIESYNGLGFSLRHCHKLFVN